MEKIKLYLQNIAENFNLNNLPADWLGVDFEKFSNEKNLFDYQQTAIENALKILYLYYDEYKENKNKFYEHYQNNGLNQDLSYNIKIKLLLKTNDISRVTEPYKQYWFDDISQMEVIFNLFNFKHIPQSQ